MEEVKTAVVETPVDAGTLETPATPIEPVVETVVTPVVDAQEDKVGDAIRKEVERREAKLREKYEQESATRVQQARDALIVEENIMHNGKQITTEADYRAMLKEQAIRKQYEGKVDDDLMEEIVESKKFREMYHREKQTNEQKAKQEAEFKAFFDTFPDTDPKNIPQAVWDEVNKGKSLVDAFTRHENQSLKQRLAELEKKKQIEQKNEENAALSTGSLVGQGTAIVANFTREQVESMSKEDMKKNYSAVVASMKTWKK